MFTSTDVLSVLCSRSRSTLTKGQDFIVEFLSDNNTANVLWSSLLTSADREQPIGSVICESKAQLGVRKRVDEQHMQHAELPKSSKRFPAAKIGSLSHPQANVLCGWSSWYIPLDICYAVGWSSGLESHNSAPLHNRCRPAVPQITSQA